MQRMLAVLISATPTTKAITQLRDTERKKMDKRGQQMHFSHFRAILYKKGIEKLYKFRQNLQNLMQAKDLLTKLKWY